MALRSLEGATAVAVLGVALGALLAAAGYSREVTGARLGAGVFPAAAALLLAGLALVQVIAGMRGAAQPAEPISGADNAAVLRALVVLGLAAVVFRPLAFIPTMTLLLATLMWIFDERRPSVVLPVALGASIAGYLLFGIVLGVRISPIPFV